MLCANDHVLMTSKDSTHFDDDLRGVTETRWGCVEGGRGECMAGLYVLGLISIIIKSVRVTMRHVHFRYRAVALIYQPHAGMLLCKRME